MSVQEDDDESPRCVAEFEEDDELSLSSSTLAKSSKSPTSDRSRHLRQLVVDLKMELAEALAQVDDLTLANRRLEQERDRAREHIRWLRGQSSSQTSTTNTTNTVDITSLNRRASDGGAPMQTKESASSSSFVRDIFQSSISNLRDETINASPTDTTTHSSSFRPDTFDDGDEDEKEHIETFHVTEHGQPILSARDVGRSPTIPTGLSLRSSLRRLSNEICNTIQPLSSEAFSESSSRPTSEATDSQVQQDETDRAAGLQPSMSRRSSMPNLRRRTSYILAQADRLHQREEEIRGNRSPPSSSLSPHGEEEDQDSNCAADSAQHETYHEYTVKTIFGKDDAAVHRQQRRDRRRRKSLVSNLQIAQARIATSSPSSEDGVNIDISPYLPSEGED